MECRHGIWCFRFLIVSFDFQLEVGDNFFGLEKIIIFVVDYQH